MRILVDGQIVELRDDRIWTPSEIEAEIEQYEKLETRKSLSSEEIIKIWDKLILNLRFDTAEEAGRFADCILDKTNVIGIDPDPSAKDILEYAGQDCDDTADRVRYPYKDIANNIRIVYYKYECSSWRVVFNATPYYVK